MARPGVDSCQVYKITIKEQNLFWRAEYNLRTLKNVNEMGPGVYWWL